MKRQKLAHESVHLDAVLRACRRLHRLSRILCTISVLPQCSRRWNLEALADHQGDSVVTLLRDCMHDCIPTDIPATEDEIETIKQSLHRRSNELAVLASELWGPSLNGIWDLLLGYLEIASSSQLVSLLILIQRARQTNLSMGTSLPTRLPIETGHVLGNLQPGWALANAPEANPADEGVPACDAILEALGYAGPPALPPGSQENVPPDGMCLAYSLLAAKDVRRLQNTSRDKYGFVQDSSAKDFRKGAKAFRERACERGLLAGSINLAEGIMQGNFPEGEALHWYAAEAGGSILVTVEYWEGATFVFGEGPIVAHVLNHLQKGPDMQDAPHYLLLQSWLPQPSDACSSSSSSDSE